MKRPTPRSYGLNSDHPTIMPYSIGVDPAQPFTDEELALALHYIVRDRALAVRQSRYAQAMGEWEYNSGGR